MGIDPKSFEYAVGQIDNGFIFEEFACSFLAQILEYDFIPAGGIKDRGIDGLEHFFHRKGFERNIYQASIEKNPENKIRNSLDKIITNQINFDQFYFITNQEVKNQDRLVDNLYEKYRKPIRIFDIMWLSARINTNPGTLNVFHTFVNSYLHEFSQPGKSYVVGDLINDPRLFVFLRQQWDNTK